tara:strand:+ start:147 stop:509 length:363 start_codon:yes stop_codon:yes gene_type:complete
MTSSARSARSTLRAIDRLKKAANLEATKKEVELSDGTVFEMWVAPLTMAERERAQKGAKTNDANEFALRLLISKAQDESGQRLFAVGEIDVLKNEVRDADLQALMLAVITDEDESIDPKS